MVEPVLHFPGVAFCLWFIHPVLAVASPVVRFHEHGELLYLLLVISLVQRFYVHNRIELPLFIYISSLQRFYLVLRKTGFVLAVFQRIQIFLYDILLPRNIIAIRIHFLHRKMIYQLHDTGIAYHHSYKYHQQHSCGSLFIYLYVLVLHKSHEVMQSVHLLPYW